MKIHLLNDSQSYEPYNTDATTVGELKDELGISCAVSVQMGRELVETETVLKEGDSVAIVSRNKTGG